MTPDQQKLLNFIELIDQYKNVFRIIYLDNKKRLENDAEHSWHVAMMVWLFAPQYEQKINLEKCLKMALFHDLVEIYTGDVSAFDQKGRIGKAEREAKSAKKLFNQLPSQAKKEFFELFDEYEEKQTAEAKFVQALDKLQPIIQNNLSKGVMWKDYQITPELAEKNKKPHTTHSKFLLSLLKELLTRARKFS